MVPLQFQFLGGEEVEPLCEVGYHLLEVKSVARIEKLPESILPAVAYIPTRRLYWVIADGRLIPPHA